MSRPVELVVVGAGERGSDYAEFTKHFPDRAQIVGVVEPREFHRKRMVEMYDIPAENVFEDWPAFVERDKFADAAIVSTPDILHEAPAVALCGKGYHLLLEKPMAPTEEACRNIARAVEESGVMFAVGHVLRYTHHTEVLKKIIDDGRVGEIITLQHTEPIGYWHHAHSYVRGNWRKEAESSNILLAKCCHDLDWIRYIMNAKCEKVSSFGSLSHFREDQAPEGSTERCLDCPCEAQCPYSAKKIYHGYLNRGETGWPVKVVVPELTPATLDEALREGPYGRCVYRCDNDVVDHQVVNFQFANKKTASFTMTAFSDWTERRTRIFGTRGELDSIDSIIKVFDFLTDETETIDATPPDDGVLSGHGGGDGGLMDAFIRALETNDPSHIRSSGAETLESHLMVFAAERARKENKVISLI